MRAPEGFVPVPSWAVTVAMLVSWGFPVKVTAKSMGEVMTLQEGASFSRARFDAWAAGFVRLGAAVPEGEQARREALKAQRAAEREAARAEALAWALAQPRVLAAAA